MLALGAGVCTAAMIGSPMQSHAESQFTPEQQAELKELFKQYLAEHPREILDSVENFRLEQERLMEQSAQDNLKEYQAYLTGADMPSAGNPDGDVTVVEFFDYNCGYCRKAYEDVIKLIDTDKNVRVVFMEMPILSPSSRKMSEYALAAHKQGKYFDMHNALMNYRGTQNDAAYEKLAADAGLDLAKLKEDMASKDVADEIAKAMEVARVLGIKGTPGFVIGDNIFPGYIGLDPMIAEVKKVRAAGATPN